MSLFQVTSLSEMLPGKRIRRKDIDKLKVWLGVDIPIAITLSSALEVAGIMRERGYKFVSDAGGIYSGFYKPGEFPIDMAIGVSGYNTAGETILAAAIAQMEWSEYENNNR